MPLQNFVAKVGPPISAVWLNAVDVLKFTVFGDATTPAQARANLTSDAPLEVGNGGTGTRGSGASFLAFLASFFPSLYQYINPITPGEAAALITPTDFSYLAGDPRRHGAIADSGITNNLAALQAALTANAGYGPVRIFANAGGYFGLSGRLTAPANTRIVLEGGELRWAATSATGTNWLGGASRPGIESLGDNFILEGKGKITGPGTAAANSGAGGGGVTALVSNEFGILRVGPSAAARGTGFVIRGGVEISLWGQAGVATQFMQDITVMDSIIHDIGYQGIVHLSPRNVREHRNKIYGIAPGISSNAYGMLHSHDSTNYSADPNVTSAPRQTVNPFPIDVDCAFNEIRDVPLWNGIDFHGGYECSAHHNRTYNCHRGIQLGGSSDAAVNYAGENNHVESNDIYGPQINGNPTTDTNGFQAGIVVNGGATLTHRAVTVRDNHLYGIGHASLTPSVYGIEFTYCNGIVLEGNTFHGCAGRAMYASNSSGIISKQYFDSVGASAVGSYCIYLDSNCGAFAVTDNIHSPRTGTTTPYTNGLSMPGSGYTPIVESGNDFTPCTTPYGGVAGLTRGNSELPATITDTTTGSHTASIAAAGAAPQVAYNYNAGAGGTLTSLTGGTPGQIVNIYVASNVTLIVNDTGSTIKLAGGTASLPQFATLTLLCVNTAGNPQFVEIGRSLANT